jgi:hypothetical protein
MGLKWVLEIVAGMVWSGFTCLIIGTVFGSCEHGDETTGFGATELGVLDGMQVLTPQFGGWCACVLTWFGSGCVNKWKVVEWIGGQFY